MSTHIKTHFDGQYLISESQRVKEGGVTQLRLVFTHQKLKENFLWIVFDPHEWPGLKSFNTMIFIIWTVKHFMCCYLQKNVLKCSKLVLIWFTLGWNGKDATFKIVIGQLILNLGLISVNCWLSSEDFASCSALTERVHPNKEIKRVNFSGKGPKQGHSQIQI